MAVSDEKNKKIILWIFALIFIIIACAVPAVSNTGKEPLSETRFMLDTVCTVTIYGRNGSNEVIDGAFGLCENYEKLLSQTVSGSDIFRINHSGGKPVEVSQETADLLKRAIEYCRLSEGEFDITIAPVKALWNFSEDEPYVPDSDRLKKAVQTVDYTKISIEGSTVTIPEGMGIDLGAIAKGYIADRMAEYLRSEKVASAIIDLGGNIYAVGSKPDGKKWRVGIREPFSDGEADVVEVSDMSVVTSGVYQRYFEKDGTIFHHILNSTDGMPCDTGLYSVSVISGSSEQCDALSTVCMLLGYERSLQILSEIPDIRAVFITSDNHLLYYK